ncbi:integrase [Pseudoalteromonas sp. Hal040]|uniref:integrase n=1 Tax=unclassified Pseudoalteromonas TaxID=194690 RepID=UPI00301DF17C
MENNIYHFVAKAELTAKENLTRFIEVSKTKLSAFGKNCWEESKWATHKGTKKVIARFATNTKPFDSYNYYPMATPFIDFAKAYIRYIFSYNPVSNLQRQFEALRILEEALILAKGSADVLLLDGLVLEQVNILFPKRLSNKQGRNKAGYQMELLLDFCRDNQITPSLPQWKNNYTREKDLTISLDEKGIEHRNEQLPSNEEMMLVANMFSQAPTYGVEAEYYTSAMAILMTAPSRFSELTLPIDCFVKEEDRAGIERLGIRWNPSKKGKKGIKWVPTEMKEVVIEAHSRLIRVGESARLAAKFAENNPGIFYRHSDCLTPPDYPEDKILTPQQLGAALGLVIKNESSLQHGTKWLKDLYEKNNGKISYRALGQHQWAFYTSKFPNWPFIDNERKVKVSEALMLYRENEFNPRARAAKPFSFLFPTCNQVNDRFIQKDSRSAASLWVKHGFKKADGTYLRVDTHGARHWLSTMAERGGMDAVTLANWAGRALIRDNASYDHRTEQEKADEIGALMIPEDASSLDKINLNIPVSYEDIGSDLPGCTITTELGLCVHDYAMLPCQRHGDCETCKELVCIKGFSKSLELLKQREKAVVSQLEKAMKEHELGAFGADRWVDNHMWRLAHIRTKIRLLEDESIPDGTALFIPEQYDPSPSKEVLRGKGLTTGIPSTDELEMQNEIFGLLRGDDA